MKKTVKILCNLILLAAASVWLFGYWQNILWLFDPANKVLEGSGKPGFLIKADLLLFIILGVAGLGSLSSVFWFRLPFWVRLAYGGLFLTGLVLGISLAFHQEPWPFPRSFLESYAHLMESAGSLLIVAISALPPVATGRGYPHYIAKLFRERRQKPLRAFAGIFGLSIWMAFGAFLVLAAFVVEPQLQLARARADKLRKIDDDRKNDRISRMVRCELKDLGPAVYKGRPGYRDFQMSIENTSDRSLWVPAVDAKVIGDEMRARNPEGIEVHFETLGKRWMMTSQGVYTMMGPRPPRLEIPPKSRKTFVVPADIKQLSKTHTQIRSSITVFESPTAPNGAAIPSEAVPIERDAGE